jgi:hypothetical protein
VTSGAVSVAAKRQLKKMTTFELFIEGRVSKIKPDQDFESFVFVAMER